LNEHRVFIAIVAYTKPYSTSTTHRLVGRPVYMLVHGE